MLHLISKVIKKVIHDQTVTFPEFEKPFIHLSVLFSKKALYGFLSYLNDKICKRFDKGMMTGMILTDLQKAFERIDHNMLLQKLHAIGFSKRTVNQFKSYLSNRTFLANLGINFFQPASVS